MIKILPRSGFNSPRLVRLLAELVIEEVPESKQSFAERLGHWLDLTDAIALSGALNASAGNGAADRPLAHATVADEFARVRATLTDSIVAGGVAGAGKARIKLPTPNPGATLETVADFLPYRRYYLAHQRDMEAGIGPLRAMARAALAGCSPALARLAAVDAAMEKALAERERNLLTAVPFLLEKRFERLRQGHRQALVDAPRPDDPAQWLRPGGWLAAFCRDLQAVLLAELEVRLQPVAGLVEAFNAERPQETAAAVSSPRGGKKTRGGPSFS